MDIKLLFVLLGILLIAVAFAGGITIANPDGSSTTTDTNSIVVKLAPSSTADTYNMEKDVVVMSFPYNVTFKDSTEKVIEQCNYLNLMREVNLPFICKTPETKSTELWKDTLYQDIKRIQIKLGKLRVKE